MANHKLVKWAVGLSGVALFTGFVGITQQNDQNNPAIQTTKQAANNQSQSNSSGSVQDQWANTVPSPYSGGDDGSGSGVQSGGSGSDLPSGSDQSGMQSGSSGLQNSFPGSGRMRGGKVRSHAS